MLRCQLADQSLVLRKGIHQDSNITIALPQSSLLRLVDERDELRNDLTRRLSNSLHREPLLQSRNRYFKLTRLDNRFVIGANE
jgi:hypothetical protein